MCEVNPFQRGKAAIRLGGDMLAITLILDRIAPARKERSVTFTMLPMKAPEDALAAMSAILQAVAESEVTSQRPANWPGWWIHL